MKNVLMMKYDASILSIVFFNNKTLMLQQRGQKSLLWQLRKKYTKGKEHIGKKYFIGTLGPRRKKICLREFANNKGQTSLRISADWSAPLLFAFWKVPYLKPHSHCADVATVHPDSGQPVYRDAPGHIS